MRRLPQLHRCQSGPFRFPPIISLKLARFPRTSLRRGCLRPQLLPVLSLKSCEQRLMRNCSLLVESRHIFHPSIANDCSQKMMNRQRAQHGFTCQIVNESGIDQKMPIVLGSRSMHHVRPQFVSSPSISVGRFDIPFTQTGCQERHPHTEVVRDAPPESLGCRQALKSRDLFDNLYATRFFKRCVSKPPQSVEEPVHRFIPVSALAFL